MPRASSLAPAILAMAGLLPAAEFVGQLDAVPAIGTRSGGSLAPAPAELVAQLPEPPAADARVWALRRPLEIKGRAFLFAAVETEPGRFTVWLDRDADGRWSADERWSLGPDAPRLATPLVWNNGIFRDFPFELEVGRGPRTEASAPPGYAYNFNVVFGATVDVEGRELRLTFAPRPAESAIALGTARISMDANFNGRIEPAIGEVENPSGKSPVFRVGRRYLAVKSVDMATGAVVLEERPASDYTRFDALPGQEMPDFAFTTFDGATHKLSDFRGRYVLLDFWGTWCGPCIAEMKHLDPLYAKYRDRGFEVIGMNMEKTNGSQTPEVYAKDEEKVRAFLAKAGHRWLQATQRSIERVAIDVIHVNSYPTCILIGPDGKVVSREARGKELEALLAQAFPES